MATATKACVVPSSSSTNRRVSAVRPVGPGAAPLRALLKLASDKVGWRSGIGGWLGRGWCSGCWYGSGGRRLGSRSSCSVLSSPGAKAAAVSAWRAVESSPW